MKLTYRDFVKQGIDLAPLEVAPGNWDETYFCTPRGARMIGWAGVDGIHFCFIRGFGEMVFAVSPMNPPPHYVHPLSRDFADFLRLLLACGGSAALEQAWQWEEGQFAAYLAENPPTQAQKAVLEQISKQTGLTPMEEPWQYLHELQGAFDERKLKYTEAFYDPEMNPDAPQPPPAWKVFYDGNFWGHSGRGRAGKEVAVRREFDWAGRHWIIPSVYLCGKGLVVDVCMGAAPARIRAFMEQWDLNPQTEALKHFTQEQRMQMDLDNPMHLDFHALLHLNGRELSPDNGCGTSYNPCLPPEDAPGDEARRAVEHYGLDPGRGWAIWRFTYPWGTKRRPAIRSLSLTMIQERVSRPGPHFRVGGPGDRVAFSYGGREHVLEVREYGAQAVDWSRMPDTGLERPSHYVAMSYTVTPELPDGVLTLADCDDGDRPRQAPSAPGQPVATPCAMVMGIISPAASQGEGKLHAACSSLYFAPVEQVQWRMVFHEKQAEDKAVDLSPP